MGNGNDRNDTYGYRHPRAIGAYSKEGGLAKLTAKKDYGQDVGSNSPHDIWDRVENQSEDPGIIRSQRGPLYMDNPNWSPTGFPRGGADPQRPKGDATTKSPKAASPSGKYAKPGGKGQRSGA